MLFPLTRCANAMAYVSLRTLNCFLPSGDSNALTLSAARKFRADLIYTWLPQSAVVALWRGYPVVLEMHADVTGLLGPWWLRRFWKARGRKRMTVTTQGLRKALEQSTGFGFENEAVIIAPNGVDLEKYEHLPDPSNARRQLNLEDGLTVA